MRQQYSLTFHILERVRFRLFLSNLTQREVEKRLGFSKGYLSQLFSGTVEIKYWQLLAILHAMGLDPSEFFAELFPRRHPALETLADFRDQAPQKSLSLELARLYAFGIETILDLYERLERCEVALGELVEMGLLKHSEN